MFWNRKKKPTDWWPIQVNVVLRCFWASTFQTWRLVKKKSLHRRFCGPIAGDPPKFGGHHWYPKRLANQDVSGYHHEITMILKERAIKLHRFESEIGQRLLSSGCCCGIQFHFRVLVTISDSSHIWTHRSTGQFSINHPIYRGKWLDLKTQKLAKFLLFRRNSFRGPLFFFNYFRKTLIWPIWMGGHPLPKTLTESGKVNLDVYATGSDDLRLPRIITHDGSMVLVYMLT